MFFKLSRLCIASAALLAQQEKSLKACRAAQAEFRVMGWDMKLPCLDDLEIRNAYEGDLWVAHQMLVLPRSPLNSAPGTPGA